MIISDRQALKLVAQLTVDSQFCNQYGTQVFGYRGDDSEEYRKLCSQYQEVIADIEKTLALIKPKILANKA